MINLQDKILSKDIVLTLCPTLNVPKTLGVYNSSNDFFRNKPDRPYVLKTNNGCGFNYLVVKESDEPGELQINKLFNKVEQPYGLAAVEWTYQHIKPAVFSEELLYAKGGLHDYKVYVVKGIPRLILVCLDRLESKKYVYYDENWSLLKVGKSNVSNAITVDKPNRLGEMLSYASQIAQSLDFCRVDFYIIEGEIYFGEVCFYPEGGYIKFEPPEFNNELYQATVLEDRPFKREFYS